MLREEGCGPEKRGLVTLDSVGQLILWYGKRP